MARLHSLLCWLLVCVSCGIVSGCTPAPEVTVVLIGGAQSEGPGRHDYPDGVRRLQALLTTSPDARRARVRVEAYPDGWPQDPAALDRAAAIVWYFDGLDRHPLRDAARRARFETAMRRGAGLVVLHQASTVPPGEDFGLPQWLGGVRDGMFDRTTESATLNVATPSHPLGRGLQTFTYRDEFYPTLRFSKGVVPILNATLHPQFRDGRPLLEDIAETRTVAWAWQRAEGGRSFGFSGAHYQATLDEPPVRTLLLNAILWSAGIDVPEGGARVNASEAAAPVVSAAPATAGSDADKDAASTDIPTFHVDRARSGWHARETVLTPANVADEAFGLAWESPPLDHVDGQPPRLYASPLYIDRVTMSAGQHRGATFSVVFAASNNGYVYAINAAGSGDVAPGRILWRTRLGAPCRLQPAPLDGIPTGILSTPVIDPARKRLYVTHCDPVHRWQAHALDLTSGTVLPGWPVKLDEATFNAVNRNAGPARVPPKRRFDFRVQRGALNLSPDGHWLYVVFGESETGWLVAVDTMRAKVGSAFAAVAMPHRGSGGIWGAGGPAVDAQGNVFVVTGSGFDGYKAQPHDWTQSVLMLSQTGGGDFVLKGTYTPFNHCGSAEMDIDLGSGGAMLLADIDPATTATPRLMAVGGKQGNVYLLDRGHLPGRLDRRPGCSTDASTDASLLPPQPQQQFGGRGPLNVFGPYSERDAALDLARARSVPAHFRDAQGVDHLYVTGNTKRAQGSADSKAPSVVRLQVVSTAGRASYLRTARANGTLVLGNPGSPVVSSDGARNAIVWILDENAPRSASLAGAAAPRPALYALDATTLDVLWQSRAGELATSGKYNEPAFGRGQVLVGTDRIQAFGLGGVLRHRPPPVDAPGLATGSSPSPAAATASLSDVATGAAGKPYGEALYRQRCAICHDAPQGNVPPRRLIATRSHAQIVAALTSGVMRAQAQGLTAEQIDSVARFLE